MEKDIRLQIGKRLRKQREKMNMVREEFAEKAGISPQFLAEIENGKKGMSVDTLYKICTSFKFSADYMLFGNLAPDSEKLPEPFSSYKDDILEIVNNIIRESQNINYKNSDKK